MTDVNEKIAEELKVSKSIVEEIAALLKEDASVSFMAHYRKDRTGGLDEAKLRAVRDRLRSINELEQRRATALKAISEAGKLTPELQAKIEGAANKPDLEDLYMSFRSRRRTRSTAARAKGLEPLADLICKQETASVTVEELVKPHINAEKGVKDIGEALSGARDMVAERISECPVARKISRDLLLSQGKVTAKAREGTDLSKGKFASYAQFSEQISKIPSHRILAIMRGASEKQLSVVIEAPREQILQDLKAKLISNTDATLKQELVLAIEEAYDRLLAPSMDNELRQELKRRADLEAIEVFAKNLRALLLHAPFGEKPVLAIGPAPRNGCKAVVLDASGKLITHTLLHPHGSKEPASAKTAAPAASSEAPAAEVKTEAPVDAKPDAKKEASDALVKLIKDNGVKAIAIGSGNGAREADVFVRDVLKSEGLADVIRVVVNESGATLYSASPIAREEFPDLDVNTRATISIGRRLQDPLAELAKLDPKSIGVGQYQHDVDQNLLKQELDDVVSSCLNSVGVDVNTANAVLLHYVSGVGSKLAKPFADTRAEKGRFKTRQDFKGVAGLEAKDFEQCAGFLRIRGGDNVLDATSIHPESYPVVEAMAASLNIPVRELLGNAELVGKLDLEKFKSEQTGPLTLKDIVATLANPKTDVRGAFVVPEFKDDVREVKDLKDGMVLSGVVTNLTAFGAFVDIGVHQDGLVHISAITSKFIRDPSEAVVIGQHVKVKVLSVDQERKRISLSMKALEEPSARKPRPASGAARAPRPPRPAQAVTGGDAPAAAGTPGAARPPRSERPRSPSRPPRGPRPGDTAAAPASGAPATGAATGTPASGSDRPRGDRGPGGRPGQGSRPGQGPRRDEGSRDRPKPVAPGMPDYSKFFVKSKRKEKEKKREDVSGASRDEVRQVMRGQNSGGTTLGDLLKKAGVISDEK
jgi:uncharacterized protein